jgi:hypothetical protein
MIRKVEGGAGEEGGFFGAAYLPAMIRYVGDVFPVFFTHV